MNKKTKPAKSDLSLKIAKKLVRDVWPNERDFFERPDRYKYVRKLLPENGCVFCASSKEKPGFGTLCLYQDEQAMVLLNKYPYNTGHCLILPRSHVASLWDLSPDVQHRMMDLISESLKIIKGAYGNEGFNVGLNHGASAGAGIPSHLHWHVVPRWSGDTNFFPLIAHTKVLPETLEQTYNRLSGAFAKLTRD